jgi:hypothetical protein
MSHRSSQWSRQRKTPQPCSNDRPGQNRIKGFPEHEQAAKNQPVFAINPIFSRK